MNTKSLLLFIIFLVICPQTISYGNQQKQSDQPVHTNFTSSKNDAQQSDKPFSPYLPLPDDCGVNHHHHNGDDDGKCHHFHFDRMAKRRYKMTFCFLGKLILLLAHLSSLLIGFQYLQ